MPTITKSPPRPTAKLRSRLQTNKHVPVQFQIPAEPGSQIFIAGSFNDWNPQEHKLKDKQGVYKTSLPLAPGQHEYKFVVNGIWTVDPNNQAWVPNNMGSLNSVITVTEQ